MRERIVIIGLGLGLAGCPASAPVKPGGDVGAVAAVPALFGPLFEPGAVAVYAWQFEVDTHDEEGTVAKLDLTLTCRAGEVRSFGELRAVEWSCEAPTEGALDGAEVSLGGVWVSSPRGLWRASTMPGDAAAAAAVVQTPMFLAAEPVEGSETREEANPQNPEMPDTVTLAVTREAIGEAVVWCRTEALDTTMSYPYSEEICFHPQRGVVERIIVGREGPSTDTLKLVTPPERGPM